MKVKEVEEKERPLILRSIRLNIALAGQAIINKNYDYLFRPASRYKKLLGKKKDTVLDLTI